MFEKNLNKPLASTPAGKILRESLYFLLQKTKVFRVTKVIFMKNTLHKQNTRIEKMKSSCLSDHRVNYSLTSDESSFLHVSDCMY